MSDSTSYQNMLSEVEQIVKDIASPNLDLDLMVEKVEKGYELIQSMQTRLDTTKSRIEELSQKFEVAKL